VLGLVIYLLLSVILMFTIPNEIEEHVPSATVGRARCPAVWGLWFLLPDHRQHHLVPQGPAVAQRLLAEQGRPARLIA
jgi:hypothetical protein